MSTCVKLILSKTDEWDKESILVSVPQLLSSRRHQLNFARRYRARRPFHVSNIKCFKISITRPTSFVPVFRWGQKQGKKTVVELKLHPDPPQVEKNWPFVKGHVSVAYWSQNHGRLSAKEFKKNKIIMHQAFIPSCKPKKTPWARNRQCANFQHSPLASHFDGERCDSSVQDVMLFLWPWAWSQNTSHAQRFARSSRCCLKPPAQASSSCNSTPAPHWGYLILPSLLTGPSSDLGSGDKELHVVLEHGTKAVQDEVCVAHMSPITQKFATLRSTHASRGGPTNLALRCASSMAGSWGGSFRMELNCWKPCSRYKFPGGPAWSQLSLSVGRHSCGQTKERTMTVILFWWVLKMG